MGGFFGGDTKTVNTTKTYEANPLTQQYAAQAQAGVANADPFSQMTARNIAPMTADQLASFQATRNAQGQASPYFTAAQDYLQQGSTPIDMGRVGDLYKNIYDPLARSQSDIFKQQMSQTTGNAVQAAGGTGADRIGVAQAQLAKQQGLAAGELGSRTMQQALDQYNQEKMRQQSAAVLSGNLGMGAQGANLQAIGALNQMGGQQMQFEQLLRDAPWLFQNQAAMFPLQQAMMQGQLTSQLAPGLGGTTTGTETTQLPEQGWGIPVIGGLMTGAGALMSGGTSLIPSLGSAGFGLLSGGSNFMSPGSGSFTRSEGGRVSAFDKLLEFATGGAIDDHFKDAPKKAEGGGFDDFNARFGAASGDNYDIPNPMLAAATNYIKDQQRFDPTPNTTPLAPDDGGTYDMPRPPELGNDLGNIGEEPKWGLGEPFATSNPAIESDRRAGYDADTDPAAGVTAMAFAPEATRPDQPGADFPPRISPPPPGGLPNIPDFGSLAKREKGFADSPGFALMNAGLGMMAASGERDAQGFLKHQGFAGLLGAAGKGGQEGLKTVQLQRQQAREDQKLELSAQKHLFEAQKDLLPYTTRTLGQQDAEAKKNLEYFPGSQDGPEGPIEGAWEIDKTGKSEPKFIPGMTIRARSQERLSNIERIAAGLRVQDPAMSFEESIKRATAAATAEKKSSDERVAAKIQQEAIDAGEKPISTEEAYRRAKARPEVGSPRERIIEKLRKENPALSYDQAVNLEKKGVGGDRRLTDTADKRLLDMGSGYEEFRSLQKRFKQEYAGYYVPGTGDIAMELGKRGLIGEKAREAALYWQDYNKYVAKLRHEVFGATLTGYEKQAWDAIENDPSRDPRSVQKNLERREAILQSALHREARARVIDGFKQESVETRLGVKLNDANKALATDFETKEQAIAQARDIIAKKPELTEQIRKRLQENGINPGWL